MSLNKPVPKLVGGGSRYTDDLYYGVELEFENWDGTTTPPPGWSITSDGSLRNSGIEFVSDVTSRDGLHGSLMAMQRVLDRSALEANARCGVHVHMNMKHLDAGQMFSFMTAYTLLEPAIFRKWCPERLNSSFCVPMYKNMHMAAAVHQGVQKLRTAKNPRQPLYAMTRTSKYAAMNASSLNKFGTLEFRQLSATTNMQRVEEWIGLLTSIHDKVTLCDDPINIVSLYEGLGREAFMETYFGEVVDVDELDQRQAHYSAVMMAGNLEPTAEELVWDTPIPEGG
jgi:hypothetical protein